MRAPQGLFLPGGGIERGETRREAAVREVVEETGLTVEISAALGVANQCIRSEEGPSTHLVKPSTFFRASVVEVGRSFEPDHHLVWLTQAEAEAGLKYESHRWAVVRDAV